MNAPDDPSPVSSSGSAGSWETLLLGPGDVRRQLDPAGGCGPACLEMVLTLENGPGALPAGLDQAALSALCLATTGPGDSHPQTMPWITSPSALQLALNRRIPPGQTSTHRIRQYHVVHAASVRGPLEEILDWLRGHHTAARKLQLPSCLLTRHGTHWMLAVGARVQADGLSWLAAADPATGRLLGLTPAGVEILFTPNTIGNHPDWTGRRVAVIPSVLARQPTPEAPPVATLHLSTPVPPPASVSPPIPPALAPLPGTEEAGLLDLLAGIAHRSSHPKARDWLAPLAHGRHIVTEARGVSAPGHSVRRAWVLDAARAPLAEIGFRGSPATLLHFVVLPPTHPPAAAGTT